MSLTPGDIFLLVISAQYLCAALVYGMGKNFGYALCFLCYALANVGLIMAASK